MRFDAIAFDADDTLWHSECFYQETQLALSALLAPYGVDHQTALDILHRIEIANLTSFGFGIKGFTISMIEAAKEPGDLHSPTAKTPPRARALPDGRKLDAFGYPARDRNGRLGCSRPL